MRTLFVYDKTVKDKSSKVRGVGRYIKTLSEFLQILNKRNDLINNSSTSILDNYEIFFTPTTQKLSKSAILFNPFFNPIAKPELFFKKTNKQIAVIHDLIPLKYKKMYPVGLKGWFFKKINAWCLRNYDAIITDSKVSKDDIVKIYKVPSTKVHVIYPSVGQIFLPHLDTKEESPTHHHPFLKNKMQASQPEFTQLSLREITHNKIISELKDYLIYVGDGTWNKNLPNIARAVKMSNIPCVFVGSLFDWEKIKTLPQKPHPWQRSYFEFLKLADGDNRFIFAGFVSDAELKTLYKYAKANILLSFDEGFGYSFIESSYMSTPSVLSDIPIFHEIAKDSALFANPQDPKDVAEKINTLIYDKYKREKLSIKAFERVQRFNPINFNSQIALLVKSLYTKK
jgi:glycosyltransferase involved in cell wall biosynthesis